MKKLISLLCAAALALSLAGCGTSAASGGETAAASTTYSLENATVLTFTDGGVTAQDGSDTGYEIDGKITTDFPVTPELKKAKPVYTTLPGWKCDLRGTTKWEDLPKAAQDYVLFIEQQIGAPITIVSTGPKRHEVIYR